MSYAHLKTLTKSGCMCFLRNFSLGLWDFEWAPDAHGWPPSSPWRSDPRPSSHQWMPRPAKQKWRQKWVLSLSIQPPRVKNLQEGETSWIYGWFLLSDWFHDWSYHISFFSVGDWDVNHWNGSEGQQTNLAVKPAIFVPDVIYVISHGSKLGTSWNLPVLRDFNSLISADLIM